MIISLWAIAKKMSDSQRQELATTYSIRKQRSVIDTLRDSQPVIMWRSAGYFLVLLFGLASLLIVPFISGLFGHDLFLTFGITLITVVLAFEFLAPKVVSALGRKFLGDSRLRVAETEARLAGGGSPDVMRDLDVLITDNLRLGRPHVAEFYSKQLLALSEQHNRDDTKMPIILQSLRSTSCFVSTPAYHKTIRYWLLWNFESTGTLCLSSSTLEYASNGISFCVNLKDVTDISLQTHPRWLRPIPLKYISISFKEFEVIQTFYLCPFQMQTDTTRDVNETVKEWYDFLTRALEEAQK